MDGAWEVGRAGGRHSQTPRGSQDPCPFRVQQLRAGQPVPALGRQVLPAAPHPLPGPAHLGLLHTAGVRRPRGDQPAPRGPGEDGGQPVPGTPTGLPLPALAARRASVGGPWGSGCWRDPASGVGGCTAPEGGFLRKGRGRSSAVVPANSPLVGEPTVSKPLVPPSPPSPLSREPRLGVPCRTAVCAVGPVPARAAVCRPHGRGSGWARPFPSGFARAECTWGSVGFCV